MLTVAETASIQHEYYRTREIAKQQPMIPLLMVCRAARHLATRRSQGSKDARIILFNAAKQICEDSQREAFRILGYLFKGGPPVRVSTRHLRIPLNHGPE